MRIAIIADIHGNLVALDTVLAVIDREQIDQVICLGDIAEDGPQPREVIARLRERGYPCVLGNTDVRMFDPPLYDFSSARASQAAEADMWSVAQLSDSDRAYLCTLPLTLEVTLGQGATLLCYHGSPRANTDSIVATTPAHELDALFAGYHATLLIGAHTHAPFLRRHRRMLVANPGSVGLPMELDPPAQPFSRPPWAEYALVSWGDQSLHVDLRRVPVDTSAVVRAARASGMPHAERWANDWLIWQA